MKTCIAAWLGMVFEVCCCHSPSARGREKAPQFTGTPADTACVPAVEKSVDDLLARSEQILKSDELTRPPLVIVRTTDEGLMAPAPEGDAIEVASEEPERSPVEAPDRESPTVTVRLKETGFWGAITETAVDDDVLPDEAALAAVLKKSRKNSSGKSE